MFSILGLLAEAKDPLGISDIAGALNYNRSTVFNIAYTLTDLGILEKRGKNKFHLGTHLLCIEQSIALDVEEYIGYTSFCNSLEPQSRIVRGSYLGRGSERPDQRLTQCFLLRIFERNRHENGGPLCPDVSPGVIPCEISNPKIGL